VLLGLGGEGHEARVVMREVGEAGEGWLGTVSKAATRCRACRPVTKPQKNRSRRDLGLPPVTARFGAGGEGEDGGARAPPRPASRAPQRGEPGEDLVGAGLPGGVALEVRRHGVDERLFRAEADELGAHGPSDVRIVARDLVAKLG
jgi:hypothetical protein